MLVSSPGIYQWRPEMIMRSEMDKTQRLVTTALMMSLVLLGTIVFRIPIPMTQGYVNLGDAMVFIAVMLLGKKNGTAAAGLGSALADVLGGYAMWAPWTLVIKAAMAFTAAVIIEHGCRDSVTDESGREKNDAPKKMHCVLTAAMVTGGLIMCTGYFIAEWIMYGNPAAAALGVPWNIGQAAAGMIIALLVRRAMPRLR